MDKRKYSAFTLIEMLVVMIILIVLGALSYAAYQDMHTTIRINEYASVLEENIRRVQREAMLLKREPGESWIYGLGIDFSKIDQEGTFGEYKVFKWCAEDMDYGGPKTTSDIPGYDSNRAYGGNNGQLPARPAAVGLCAGVASRKELKGYDVGLKPPKGRIELSSNSVVMETIPGNTPYVHYILFESVTGRAFFYSNSWELVGYNKDRDGKPQLQQVGVKPFEIVITPLTSGRSSRKKKISIDMFSGKVIVGVATGGLESGKDEQKAEQPPLPGGEEKPQLPKPGYGTDPIKDPILNL